MIASRRSILFGATAFLAAPSIVRVASLMPVSVVRDAPCIGYPVAYDPPPMGLYVGAGEPDFTAGVGSMFMSTDGGFYLYTDNGWTRPYPTEMAPPA